MKFRNFISLICLVPTLMFAQSSTPNIGLQIPATGSNNWYIPLNYNFNKLDQYLSGVLPVPAFNVSGNLTVGGSITAGSFNTGGGTLVTVSGTPIVSNCVKWLTVNSIGDAGSPCGSSGGGGGTGNAYSIQTKAATGTALVGVTITGIVKGNGTTGIPTAAASTDIADILKTATSCTDATKAYNPQTNTCITTAGNAITALTGDVTATGPGSVPATLATSGVSAGSYSNATFSVDNKGRITAAASGPAGPLQGTGVPTATCFAGQKYTQLNASINPVDLSQWTCSPNALVWIRQADQAVVSAVSKVAVTSGYLGAYELTETSGSFADSSGNGNTLLNNGTIPVTYNAGNGVNLGAGRYIPFTGSWMANGNSFIVCGVFFGPNGTTPGRAVLVAPGPADGYSYGLDAAGRQYFGAVAVPDSYTGSNDSIFPIVNAPICLGFTASTTNGNFLAGTVQTPGYIQGNRGAPIVTQAAAGVGAWPGGTFGSPGANSKLYKFYVYNRTLATDEFQEQIIFAESKLASQGITTSDGYNIPTGPLIAALGDSQTQGSGDNTQPPGYPPILAGIVPGGMNVVNFGVASGTSANVLNEVNNVNIAFNNVGNPALKFIPIWGATNDIFGSISPATTYAAYSGPIASTAKKNSAKTLYLTMTPSTRCVSTCESNRIAYNNLWLANTTTDGLVNIGNDIRFSNPLFTPYLSGDGLHMSHFGYTMIANRVLTEMNRLGFSGTQAVYNDTFATTMDLDISKGTYHSIPVTANITSLRFTNFNQGTTARVDFLDPVGGNTITLGVVGSGATAHTTLAGAATTLVIDTGGTNYDPNFPPTIVVSGGTCSQYPQYIATISAGAITGATAQRTSNCSVNPTTVTFISNEAAYSGPSTIVTVANVVTSLYLTWDINAANYFGRLITYP